MRHRTVPSFVVAALAALLLVPTPAGAGPRRDGRPDRDRVVATSRVDAQADASITFSEFPLGTTITDQYAPLGIVFTATVFITSDGDNPTSPVLSGSPTFTGPISAAFVDPDDSTIPAVVDTVSMDAGYFNDLASTELTAYDIDGNVVDSVLNSTDDGIERLTVSGSDIASFTIANVGAEVAGYAIDNLAFPEPMPIEAADLDVCIREGDDDAVGLPTVRFGGERRISLTRTDVAGCIRWTELEDDDPWSALTLGIPERFRGTPEADAAIAALADEVDATLVHPGIRPLIPFVTEIGFEDLAEGTVVSDQYVDDGIRFGGETPTVAQDTGFETAPVLRAGSDGAGVIVGRFVSMIDEVETPTTRQVFAFDVGVMNQRGSVQVTLYDLDDIELATKTTMIRGVQTLVFNQPGTHRFRVEPAEDVDQPARRRSAAVDGADAFAIDNVAFGLPVRSTFIEVCITRDGDAEADVPVELLSLRGTFPQFTEADGCTRFDGRLLYLLRINR